MNNVLSADTPKVSTAIRVQPLSNLPRDMSIPPKWKDHKEARDNQWFSRRHETNEALLAARAKRLSVKKSIKLTQPPHGEKI